MTLESRILNDEMTLESMILKESTIVNFSKSEMIHCTVLVTLLEGTCSNNRETLHKEERKDLCSVRI